MAGKRPSFQFYPGDWMKDPALSLCSAATRGIWMDLLCAMHCGDTWTLTGTYTQLARLARCSEDEIRAAIIELQTTNCADVEVGNADVTAEVTQNVTPKSVTDNKKVTLTSRRLERELSSRKFNRDRQKRYREKTCEKSNAESNANVAPTTSVVVGNQPSRNANCGAVRNGQGSLGGSLPSPTLAQKKAPAVFRRIELGTLREPKRLLDWLVWQAGESEPAIGAPVESHRQRVLACAAAARASPGDELPTFAKLVISGDRPHDRFMREAKKELAQLEAANAQ